MRVIKSEVVLTDSFFRSLELFFQSILNFLLFTERFILAMMKQNPYQSCGMTKITKKTDFYFDFWTLTARLRDFINKLFAKVNKTKNHSFSNCDNASSFPESCEKCSLLCSLATVDSIPTNFTKNRWKFQIQICSVNSKSRPAKNNLQQVFHFDEFFQFE